MLPPPVDYPKRRRWWPAAVALLVIALAAAGAVAVGLAARKDKPAAVLTPESARAAIQDYLDALTSGDDETVARHTLCGLYDAVRERRADVAVAGMASDAFRKQFSRAEVTSIDKMVPWSATQAQVLFTMRVAPASGSTRGQQPPNGEEQGVAQVLAQGNEVLVCSYLLRTGQY